MREKVLSSGYEVYFFERGIRDNVKEFSSKEEAYSYIYSYFFELSKISYDTTLHSVKFKLVTSENEFVVEESLDLDFVSLIVHSGGKCVSKHEFDDIESAITFVQNVYGASPYNNWAYVA